MIPDRELPNAPDAERALLGCVLLDANRLPETRAIIGDDPAAFWVEKHQALWCALLVAPPANGERYDGIVLQRVLGDEFGKLGGYDFLAELISRVPSGDRAAEYAGIMAELHARRRVISAASRTMDSAYDPTLPLDELETELDNLTRLVSADGSGPGPVLLNMSDVLPEHISWLWPGRIAHGKVTMIAGDPGLGKSFLTLDIAARVSRGHPFPDSPDAPNPAGGVVLLSAEDDPGDTIRPRLDEAGADVSRIGILTAVRCATGDGPSGERPFNLTRDLCNLERAIDKIPGCRLVVIDPISAYLGGTDSHKNADVRAVLAPLSELAGRLDVAVVAVTHLRKGDGPALYRSMGSLAFVAAARSAWAVSKDPDDPTGRRRLFLPMKNNIAPDLSGLAFELRPSGETAVIAWNDAPVTISADEALSAGRDGQGEQSAVDEVVAWLEDYLSGGPQPSKEVKRQAKEDGIALRTLDRAKAKLGVVPGKDGMQGGWHWRLPEDPIRRSAPTQPEECQQKVLATFEDVGALRIEPPLSTPEPTPVATDTSPRLDSESPPAAWIPGNPLTEHRDGWTAESWHDEILRKAVCCETSHPGQAAEYREAAEKMRAVNKEE